MEKLTNKELLKLKREVKGQTGYNLKDIDITMFSNNHIDYTVTTSNYSKLTNRIDFNGTITRKK